MAYELKQPFGPNGTTGTTASDPFVIKGNVRTLDFTFNGTGTLQYQYRQSHTYGDWKTIATFTEADQGVAKIIEGGPFEEERINPTANSAGLGVTVTAPLSGAG